MAPRASIVSALAGSRRAPLPRQQPPRLIEGAYARALLALVMARVQDALAPVLRELPSLLARAAAKADAAHADADEVRNVRVMLDLSRAKLIDALNEAEIRSASAKHATEVSTYNRVQLGRQVEAGLGSNILGVDKRAKQLINAFPEVTGAALRSRVGERVVGDIQSLVIHAMGAGKLYPSIQSKVERRLEIAANTTRMIAANEVGNLYAAVNVARQRELGIKRFVWRSVGDDRVRDEHEARDGEMYEFDSPPDDELPGEPPMCRCWAEPVFEGITEDPEDEPYESMTVAEREPAGFETTTLPDDDGPSLVPEIPELDEVLASLEAQPDPVWGAGASADLGQWGAALTPQELHIMAEIEARVSARRPGRRR